MSSQENPVQAVAPKYEQVRRILFEQIRHRRMGVGAKIPSEAELMRRFSVSRVTVRRAVRHLVRDGILQSEAGVGTIVRARAARPPIGIVYGRQFCRPQDVPAYRLLIDALQRILAEQQFAPRLYFVRSYGTDQPSDRDQFSADLRRGLLQGVLAVAWPCPEFEDAALAAADRELLELIGKLPCSGWSGADLPGALALDYESVGYLGTRHFLDKGLDRVSLIVGVDRILDQKAVVNGYRRALGERDLHVRPPWLVRTTELSRPAGYEAMRQLWSLDQRPRAVVIADDIMAQGSMTAAL